MSSKRTVAKLLFPFIRLWAASWRFKGNMPSGYACIMLMWHEELFPVLKACSNQDWTVIVSPSKDGDFLERLITHWGHKTIRGSANDKAVLVLYETIKLAKRNKMTVGSDGPRGPRRHIKIGMLMAAQEAGVPIYLVRIKANGFRLHKAWDKSLIPYPFAKVQVLISEPIAIDREIGRDQLKDLGLELNQLLNQLGDDNP